MDQSRLTVQAAASARLWGRWLLLGAVIAGVLAMHVLSEPEGFDGHSMPAGLVTSAEMAVVMDVPVVPAMAMAGAGSDMPVRARQPVARAVGTNMVAPAPGGMSGMTCCTLFLLTGARILLLALLLRVVRRQPYARLGSKVPHLFWRQRRGPPTIPDPRIVLCVLRV